MIRTLLLILLLVPTALLAQSTPQITYTGYPLYAKAITPHDTNPLTDWAGNATSQYVFVGGTGNVACVPAGNATTDIVIFSAVPAGTFVPVMCKLVRSTNTTATGLIGIF